jgi:hypothetical protein
MSRALLSALVFVVALNTFQSTVAPLPTAAASGAMLIDRATLLSLPTSGTAWSTLKSVADGSLGSADLRDQNNTHSARTLAAALVGVRLNSVSHLDKARAGLRAAQGTEVVGSSNMVLAAGRQLVGYIIAADLIGYRDPGFVSWVSGMRTRELGGHGRWTSLAQTHADTANNWGAWAGASRVAAAIYVGDTADTAVAARILRGWLGDRGAYAGFRTAASFDPSWPCDASSWTAVNPACSAGKDGAVVEEASRSSDSYPTLDSTGVMYTWQALGGAQLQALLLQRAGYGDVWEWSNRGFLRAARWLERNGGYAPPYSVNQYMPWIFDWAYATSVGPKNAAGMGRTFGFTDWLYGGRAPDSLAAYPYDDIVTSKFRDDIVWIHDRKLTTGCDSYRYCPDRVVTRGQMATFLARALKLPTATRDYFTDDTGSVHEPAINAIAQAGITVGCGGTRFCPSSAVTRAQMATFLTRAFGLPPTSVDYYWDDNGSKHEARINALAASGITRGCATGRFCPNNGVTRGQMAALLRRALTR